MLNNLIFIIVFIVLGSVVVLWPAAAIFLILCVCIHRIVSGAGLNKNYSVFYRDNIRRTSPLQSDIITGAVNASSTSNVIGDEQCVYIEVRGNK